MYCNSIYPFFLEIRNQYHNSKYHCGTLSDYLYINPKTDCSNLSDNDIVSFVPMANVQEKTNTVTYNQVPFKQVKKGFTVFSKGDIIWAKITPCMQNGKSCSTGNMPTHIGFGSTEFHVIRRRTDNVYMPFIWALLSNDNILKAAQATFSGSAGQQRVSDSFISEFPATIPSYDEQVELVKNLESALCNKNNKLQQANELFTSIDSILLSTLGLKFPEFNSQLTCAVHLSNIKADKTFGTGYYHPERMSVISTLKASGILCKKIDDVVNFIRETIISENNPQNYLGLAGVEADTGELSGINEDADGQAFLYEKNDVLYGRLRPYLNKVLLAEKKGICSTEFHVMRVKHTKELLPEYLATVMRSKLIVSQTKHMMTGNTHPRISNDDVKNLYIPIPDIKVQQKISKAVLANKKKARHLKIEAEHDWQVAIEQFEKELLGDR